MSSSMGVWAKVSWIATALNLWIRTKKSLEQEGALAVVVLVLAWEMRLPGSLRNSSPALLIGPRVSTATGMKVYDCASCPYTWPSFSRMPLYHHHHCYYYYYCKLYSAFISLLWRRTFSWRAVQQLAIGWSSTFWCSQMCYRDTKQLLDNVRVRQ